MTALFSPIVWESTRLKLLDQRKIPKEKSYLSIDSASQTVWAIREMVVRGAPAIAITGVFGLALGCKARSGKAVESELNGLFQEIQESRPTAVNLSRALSEARALVTPEETWESLTQKFSNFGEKLLDLDLAGNKVLGENGANLFSKDKKTLNIVTHCNTGALATAGHGTALGVIRSLRDNGFTVTVFADETRPFLQGSRLTAFEMMEEGIECYIITDGMSGWLFQDRKIDAVVVGCDRVAKNGDTANKIGTYTLALAAKAHSVPFYVCATKDSFDLSLSSGKEIPIEMRNPDEVTLYQFLKDQEGNPLLAPGTTSPLGAKALNPSFDVTPAHLIHSFITDLGVFSPSDIENRLKAK